MKLKCFALAISLILVVACGSRSLPVCDTLDDVEAASNDFLKLLSDNKIGNCIIGMAMYCVCPGGGSITVTGDRLFFNDCKSQSGETYSGSARASGGMTVSATMDIFASCSNVAAYYMPMSGCGGRTVALVDGDELECDIEDDPSDASRCRCDR